MAIIQGTEGADNLVGTADGDQIYGRGGNDVLDGGAGDDVLTGGAGADKHIGGAGNDIANYTDSGAGAITLNFKTGVHTGIAAGDTFESIERYVGTNYDDTFVSDASAHAFFGGVGTDTLDYSASAQAVSLTIDSSGNGTGAGGDAEGDTFSQFERVIGSALNDTFVSSANNYRLQGGAGDDVYIVNNAGSQVVEAVGGGNDEVRTSLAGYSMTAEVERLTFTGTGNFVGYGNASSNIITGGDGNDTLLGGASGDQFFGGAGTDVVAYTDSGVAVTLNFKTGVHSGIAAGDTFNSIERFAGSNYDDTFISDASAQVFIGGGGQDSMDYSTSAQAVSLTIDNTGAGVGVGGDAEGDTFTQFERVIGSAFNDTLTSNAVSFKLQGGDGDDVYVIQNATSQVIEAAGGGNDEVRTALSSYALANEVERLTYTGTGNFQGAGNRSDNILNGGAGNDILSGGAGADKFIGGAGIDMVTYVDSGAAGVSLNFKTGVHSGIAAGDTFESIEQFTGSGLDDTFVSDATAQQFFGAVGSDTMDYSTSAQAISITIDGAGIGSGRGGDAEGDSFSQFERVIGTDGNDTFVSSATGYKLQGGAGDDVYVINNTGSVVVEAAGGGNDEVRTSLGGYRLTDNIERLTFTGTTGFQGYGNASDNIITGGNSNDTLYGGAGADRLVGGNGIDTVSYFDATGNVGVTLNLKTGVHTGIAAGDTFDSIELFVGSAFDDVFVSDATAHTLYGNGGVDTMDYSSGTQAISVTIDAAGVGTGSAGEAQGDSFAQFERVIGTAYNDTFTSASTSYRLEGGAGDDVYVITHAGSVVVEAQDGGIDEVRTSLAQLRLADGVERMTFTGTGTFVGYGNSQDNIIVGGSGNDQLSGGAGADQFFGGAGDDLVSYWDASFAPITLNFKTGVHGGIAAGDTFDSIERFVGSGRDDIFVSDATAHNFDGGQANDTLDYSGSAQAVTLNVSLEAKGTGSGGDAEGDTFVQFERFIGTAFNDTFNMAHSNVTYVEGGAGNDVYVLNWQTTQVMELAGGGDDEVRTSASTFRLANEVERLTYTGNAAFTGYGNSGDNILTGGAGNDTFFGGAGADQFFGGAGTDAASYTDSKAVVINLQTNVHGGSAVGDSFDSIEKFIGSYEGDLFIGNAGANIFDGSDGVDAVSFVSETSGIVLDLSKPAITGIGAGDTYTSIETFEGTAFNDSFVGSVQNENFIGGAGADTINGGGGVKDAVWYINSSAGVRVDLGTATASGGDADGDVLISIEGVAGSAYDDVLTAMAFGSTIYGGEGNDIINGSDGNDILYGDGMSDKAFGAYARAEDGVIQSDIINGGKGNDSILGGTRFDKGSILHGDDGNDTVSTASGKAYGDLGNDTLIGTGTGYELYGGSGWDIMTMMGSGGADGGQHGDTYNVFSKSAVVILDTGTDGVDVVVLKNIQNARDVYIHNTGTDAHIFSKADWAAGNLDTGVVLANWYAGSNTIEQFQTNSGETFTIT
ncbi:beta strand repeat-containing protein [Pseudomonas fontis]|uniref:Calcium-binding protein n=1 Tax=Pseudomonas fontis TaxID=2942633 RepID=A0ABT5NQT5_9PSED|nr:calcium-binding protein [Pseudomonas fontis]MDD0974546.1 calcium-binding protein [Pseudomonas fontis]MDD0990511.1 calcium-binding protein [Pseudomonas fontis]